MDRQAISICHLYPDLMNLYGDRGNVIALYQRCFWHGLGVKVHNVTVDQVVEFTDYDLVFMGGGQDREQRLICDDFEKVKGSSLAEAVEAGVVLLGICGAYQLLGKYYQTAEGERIPGLGILDAWTEASSKRMIGNVVVETDLFAPTTPAGSPTDLASRSTPTGVGPGARRTIVGFENHSGRTYLGPSARPLGRVLAGYGNNGQDKTEGLVHKNAVATYLHGSVLPKNPWLTDWLIERALVRKYGVAQLPQLDDEFEERAHRAAVKRTMG